MVDGTGLENQNRRKAVAGSNPALSAIFKNRIVEPDSRFLVLLKGLQNGSN